VETGTLDDLRRTSHTSVSVRTEREVEIADLDGVSDVRVEHGHLRFQVDNQRLPAALDLLTASGVLSLTCSPPTLEELFLRHYDEPGIDDPVEAS
jgi:ABC-2 type transport system ATP-binding protein